MYKNRMAAVFGGFLAAAALMSGCAGEPALQSTVDSTAQPTTAATAAVPAATADAWADAIASSLPAPTVSYSKLPVGYVEAISTAAAQYPGAVPLSCSLDYTNGQVVWDIEMLATDGIVYETGVNAQTGVLLQSKVDNDRPEVTASEISVPYTQAVQTAMEAYPGCALNEFQVERENGTVVYDVELWDAQGFERTVFVNAQTGEALSGQQGIAAAASAGFPYYFDDDDYDDDDRYDLDDIYDYDDDDYYYRHHSDQHHR